MTMTIKQLAANVAESADISKADAQAVLGHVFAALKEGMFNGGVATPFGKLTISSVAAKPARKGRNPATGETIKLPPKPASAKPVFRFNKATKEEVAATVGGKKSKAAKKTAKPEKAAPAPKSKKAEKPTAKKTTAAAPKGKEKAAVAKAKSKAAAPAPAKAKAGKAKKKGKAKA